MPTSIFVRSHQSFLEALGNARFRYRASDDALLLFIERSVEIPPTWLQELMVEILDEVGGQRMTLDPEWIDTEASVMCARVSRPSVFRPGDRHHDFVPIGEIILTIDSYERRLPNGSSPKRFAAR